MNIEERKAKIQRWGTVALIAGAGLLVSPIIFLAVQGILGLIIAAVLGLAIVTFTPWVSMKFANWRVKAITAEAAENPIETLVNLLTAKKQAFEQFKLNVESAVTARNDFKIKCDRFARQYPHRAQEFQSQLVNMTELVDRKKKALNEAQIMLEEGENKLAEMRAYWEMSQAAQAANRAAGMSTGDLYERLKADTAVDSVLSSMNRAFAELEVAAAIDSNAALEYNEAQSVTVLPRKEKVTL